LSKADWVITLFCVGLAGLCFALARTYYLFWKLKKDREKVRKAPQPPNESL
jgi:hypothetical protein